MKEHRSRSPLVVAIPVKDEAERIVNCLGVLSRQHPRMQIVLLLNNCSDNTATVVRDFALSSLIPIHQFEVTLLPEQATAGHARRLAMQVAENFVDADGV